jgi:DNA replication protein DnaC
MNPISMISHVPNFDLLMAPFLEWQRRKELGLLPDGENRYRAIVEIYEEHRRERSDFIEQCEEPAFCNPMPAQSPGLDWTERQTKLINRMTECAKAGGIVVVYGGRGTGKTSMAKEVQSRVGYGVYELCQDYFEKICALVLGRAGRDEDEKRVYRDRRLKTRILILDEIHHVASDPIGQRVIQDLIIRRHDLRKPTILLTNATKDALNLDDSVMDRIKDGGGIFGANWDSFR